MCVNLLTSDIFIGYLTSDDTEKPRHNIYMYLGSKAYSTDNSSPINIIFGYFKFSSVTTILVELGLPSFTTVLHNAAASFNRRLGCSTNRLVIYVCNCSFYSAVPA